MATLAEKRAERTAAKRTVTVAARRLTNAVKLEMDSVHAMAAALDTAYCDYVGTAAEYQDMCKDSPDAADEFFIVNNLSLEQYDNDVCETYKHANHEYKSYVTNSKKNNEPIAEPEQISIQGQSSPSQVDLKRREIPKFSGKRKDWPEFKAIWQKLIVPSLHNQTALATELKQACKGGTGYDEIRSISAGGERAYEQMWDSLCDHFDNITLSVTSALDEMRHFNHVKEDDYEGIVRLIRQVDSIYQQLEVLDQVNLITNREVNSMVSFFPSNIKRNWAECHFRLRIGEQLTPFKQFHEFLKEQIKIAKHMVNAQYVTKPNQQKNQCKAVFNSQVKIHAKPKCCVHRSNGHTTESCKQFAVMSVDERRDALQKSGLCFRCFGNHRRAMCRENTPCSKCGRKSHHSLMCNPGHITSIQGMPQITQNSLPVQAASNSIPWSDPYVANNQILAPNVSNNPTLSTQSHAAQGGPGLTLYAIYSTSVATSSQKAVVFCDDGSDTSFISKEGVKRLCPRKLQKTSIEIDTLTGTKSLETHLYEVILITHYGRKVPVIVTELPRLSGTVSQLDEDMLSVIFPNFDCKGIQRPSGSVDLLLGGDYFGLHPKREIVSDGGNLSIMEGELGVCVQGSHPDLRESTERDSCVGYSVRLKSQSFHLLSVRHPELMNTKPPKIHGCGSVDGLFQDSLQHDFTSDVEPFPNASNVAGDSKVAFKRECHYSKVPAVDTFVFGEEIGTEVTPKCGGCKCGKCPIIGHTYSFKEEQELKLINSNLIYDVNGKHWVASYPWITDPKHLPNNYASAIATLRNTEKRLVREPEWGVKYAEQILDMENRGVARKMSKSEVDRWQGPVFYLSHLAVENPKSLTTPVRIVFNSSQLYKGVSLNSFLAKGPDSFKTNLLGMLLRFREGPVVMIGDIRKMYNSVYLAELEQHTHRFLWRDLKVDSPPETWCITRVNMGDKPAGAIAIEAKDRTADLFKHINPAAAEFIKGSSYVDDLVDSIDSLNQAHDLAKGTDEILAKGGFKVKEWVFGGRNVASSSSGVQKVLGVNWAASDDVLLFQAHLNFSPKRRNIRTGPDLMSSEIPALLPDTLTRRIVLQQVMGIFDPYGILAPFTLIAKILLRETWCLNLQWDDPLPLPLYTKWIEFFTKMFDIESLRYDRCITPEGAVGNPSLVLLSDGSESAYGCTAYIRWKLNDGTFWCRLLLAKCRIAPLRRISIPQMELNGAVLSKRCRKVIEAECRFTFDEVIHLVDSETVLGQINKLSTRFHVYEGVRVGEIQAATGGDVSCWAWISGDKNISDVITRGRFPSEIGPDSEWFRGPAFLYQPFEEWGVKFQPNSNESLPGEKKVTVNACATTQPIIDLVLSCSRCSSLDTVVWSYARVLAILKARSFKGGNRSNVTPALLRNVETILLREAQSEWTPDSVKNKFRSINPVVNDGLWVVGTRISHQSPLTPENRPQVLLPYTHPLTNLVMTDAHVKGGHRGRDATVSRFRARFWTSHATKLSRSVCNGCQLCKLRNAKRLEQVMGQMPACRLLPSPPFTSVMLDLFGPYQVRGEVQKRTSGKAWGVIFTDLCSRAVHIEVAFGYDTKSFLLALSRFSSIRGWPSVIYSDPGTQLVGASDELSRIWNAIDRDVLKQVGAKSGLQWKFGPADSPWYQGAVEALIKSVKRAIDLSVQNQRLSVPEILTVFTQAADLINERPLGIMPSNDSDISILTPNSLLLGRSSSFNPGGYDVNPTLRSRVTLVQGIVDQFWNHWTKLYAPTLIRQSKWLHGNRDIAIGDIVIVADPGVLRGSYRLGRVTQVFPSADGHVRRARVAYKRFKVGEKLHEYKGATDIEVERSVQRLALIVPVDDE